MRIFISTGEVSGDLQGSLLIAALKRQAAQYDLELEIVALGGEKMVSSGATLIGNTTSIGSFGLLESVPYILPTLQLQRRAIAYLKQHPPDLVVLIDYMGPNLAIGKYIRRHLPQVPVVYYIAPQVWVCPITPRDTSRIIAVSDKLLAIFPGEARYFQEQGAKVTWVGHPLVDRVKDFPNREAARSKLGILDDVKSIALLPASRSQEIKYLLPVMFQTAQIIQNKFPDVHFWIPLSLEIYRKSIEQAIQQYNIKATVVSELQKEVLAAADLAITKCGTVNLELALLNVPQVVLYRVHPFTYWVARKILKIAFPFASPTNLMVMKPIVPEFIQEQATPENLSQAAFELLQNQKRQQQMQEDYQEMRQAIGEVGVCDRAANEILQMIK
ncbi:lipid-A-disaccharide synthase [Aetokthonos hydrillicola Thurmond2011]|jgi:lipid-A-disaccharide synthase|uniref:Lipid-A-disaccharide synthase n=1 Tax=Aetokthonos hydrillicola Thurmond2011 TaxID=2712845 RepID=A0AAP5I864_9CYAN|nr:lipid-A-disaccharide synthase [Aetokthonos hydrillicola]MBO3460539.1 lipid-A-disaccharide synthase [Aetokthonos hydrillicola CCALA 1050]MBW4585333.1 lipid-A-disaccharide synthase [Aetokthonos hydrillicola CCALA 1050]MDR9896530.1 lipid-A-disaccharide synthase [Aetokthonos hydrillicola Thurmond2011]